MASKRKEFEFEKIPSTNEWGSAHALEFIAYYLDRIESHLEKMSSELGSLQTLVQQVQQINHKTK